MRSIAAALLGLGLFAPYLSACIWDSDTLRQEQEYFPEAHELIVGRFPQHSEAYYRWRIEDRRQRLEEYPENVAYYDDIAVAYDKLGQHDEAIATIQAKNAIQPDLYTTHANWGTFLIHAGRFEEGLEHIEQAIAINPDAHFGREIYQRLLVEYVLERMAAKKSEENADSDAADEPSPAAIPLPVGEWLGETFPEYVMRRQEIDLYQPEQVEEEHRAAVKGVLGMMRFGHPDSPVLLEAVGDLLNYDLAPGAKLLAARAYVRASYVVEDPAVKDEYVKRAKDALTTKKNVSLPDVETELKRELAIADAYQEELAAQEEEWIRRGDYSEDKFWDFAKELNQKHTLLPPSEPEPPAAGSEFEPVIKDRSIGWGIAGLGAIFLLGAILWFRTLRGEEPAKPAAGTEVSTHP